ncbi:MAG: hypothetical protein EA397_19970 [Deltaproteobacteria bacterium]|nr:MAG: hypothetical protein EA397_19970 [Deltaproteobacteria bacterium]
MHAQHLVVAAVVFAACAPVPPTLLTGDVARELDAPSVRFVEVNTEDRLSNPISVQFHVSSDDQPVSTVPLTLSSDVDGDLWIGNAPDRRPLTWTGDLSPGTHELVIEGRDHQGVAVQDTAIVRVRFDAPPECEIVRPTDGSTVVSRVDDVDFEVFAVSPDDEPLTILWRSSLDGPLAIGPTFTRRMLAVGEHVISVEVRDGIHQPCRDEILLVVE